MREALFLVDRHSRVAKMTSVATHTGDTRHYAILSYTDLTKRLGLTRGQVRSVLRRLDARGLLEVCPRHLPNGGQLENAYCMTETGREFLLGGTVRTTKCPMTAGQGKS